MKNQTGNLLYTLRESVPVLIRNEFDSGARSHVTWSMQYTCDSE